MFDLKLKNIFLSQKFWRITLTVLLISGLGRYVWRNWPEFQVFKEISVLTVSGVVVINWFQLILSAYRYRLLIGSLGLSIPFREWFQIFTTSRFLNQFFPQSGNAYRAVSMKSRFNFPLTDYIATFSAFIVIDRLLSFIFAALTVFIFEPSLSIADFPVALALLFIVLAGVAVLILFNKVGLYWEEQIGRGREWVDRARRIVQGLRLCFSDPKVIGKFSTAGAINFSVSLLVNWLLFKELMLLFDPARLSLFNVIRDATLSLSLTPGNLGINETTYGLLGTWLASAATSSIIVGFLANVTSLIALVTMSAFINGAGLLRYLKTAAFFRKDNKRRD